MIFGPAMPDKIQASGHLTDEGVDISTSMLLSYGKSNERVAVLHCSVECEGSKTVTIYGTKGKIIVHRFWYVKWGREITQ
jgi:hypothetical protein